MSKFNIEKANPFSSDYYERLGFLGISYDEISIKDVKDAFFKLVKDYPPQKKQAEFEKIRKAYDTLGNQQSKDEYDAEKEFGQELLSLKEKLEVEEKEENLDAQIKLLKKICNMSSKSSNYRNKLGYAYYLSEDYTLAIKQFKLAIEINPGNSSFYINIGDAYYEIEEYDTALNNYYKAAELDDEDHTPPIRIANILFYNKKQKNKAYQILEDAIYADGKVDFLDFFTIFAKTRFYAMDNNKSKLTQELKRILEVAKSSEEKDISSYLLVQEAEFLCEYNMYDIAEKYANAACKLNSDPELKKWAKNLLKYGKMIKQMETIQNSSFINDLVKGLITLYTSNYFGQISEAEFKENHAMAVDALQDQLDYSKDNRSIKKSIRRIKKEWPEVYSVNQELFDLILKTKPTKYMSSCPHSYCKDDLHVPMDNYGTYTCPHCNGAIDYYGTFKVAQGSSGGGWCFIATAVYDDIDHPNVALLRRFRDEVLRQFLIGRAFIKIYYRIGPFFAKLIYKKTFIKKAIKTLIIEPLVKNIEKYIENNK